MSRYGAERFHKLLVKRQMKPRALVFDAYGTLFDVHSVVVRAGSAIPGDLHALSILWRRKQLEYTWLRSLMERYEDFWNVTEAALRSAVAQLKIEASQRQLDGAGRGHEGIAPVIEIEHRTLGSLEQQVLPHSHRVMQQPDRVAN